MDIHRYSREFYIILDTNNWLKIGITMDDNDIIHVFNLIKQRIYLNQSTKVLSEKEIEHRQVLVKYAADDCLSMEQIMMKMNIIKHAPHDIPLSTEKNQNILDDTDTVPDAATAYLIVNASPVADLEYEPISDDDNISTIYKGKNKLSAEEKRKIHNRICTMKQR